MRQLFIEAVGAFTSAGSHVGETMGSFRIGESFFAETEFWGTDGNRVLVGVSDAFREGVMDPERLFAMAGKALTECAQGAPAENSVVSPANEDRNSSP